MAKSFKLIEITKDEKQTEVDTNKKFTINFQEALLLSLLEKKLLSQWQFERCMEEIKIKGIKSNACKY